MDRALDYLAKRLNCKEVEIQLRDHGFVDYLVVRRDERQIQVMQPDYQIEHFVEQERDLQYLPFHAMYQHDIKQLNTQFPYPELTLKQVGVAAWDILQVTTEQGTCLLYTSRCV